MLLASQNDDSSGIFAWQPGFGQVIVRAQKRQHLRIYTEDVLRAIEDRDNKERGQPQCPPGEPVRTVSGDISLLPAHPAA